MRKQHENVPNHTIFDCIKYLAVMPFQPKRNCKETILIVIEQHDCLCLHNWHEIHKLKIQHDLRGFSLIGRFIYQGRLERFGLALYYHSPMKAI